MLGKLPKTLFACAIVIGASNVYVRTPAIAQDVIVDRDENPDKETTVAKEVDDAEMAKDAVKVVNNWQGLGSVGGLILVINLLIKLLRYWRFKRFLEERQLKWLKPYFALGLGAVGGFLTGLSSGAGVGGSLVAGLLAGLGAVGAHEAMNPRKKAKAPHD